MWLHLAHNPELQRAAILLIPFLAAGMLAFALRPPKRAFTAIFVSFMWSFSLLLICNIIASECGWWRFVSNHSNFLGIPFDVLLGWAAFWGLLPHLVFRGKFIALTILGMVFLDLIVMPQIHPLILLGPGWLWGELAVILTCLVPSLVLARMTEQDSHVKIRGLAQAFVTGILLLFYSTCRHPGTAWRNYFFDHEHADLAVFSFSEYFIAFFGSRFIRKSGICRYWQGNAHSL